MKKRTGASGGRKLTWSTHESLSLHSEKIEEFLAGRILSHEADAAKAVDFFKKIRVMMDDSNWVITTRRADFRALNRTGGTIRSVRATVDFYADDRLFHVEDMTRTLIESNKQFEFSEEILQKVYEVAGVIRDEYGQPRGLKTTPQLRCGFREYTVEISDKHKMFHNEYVRAAAGLIPMPEEYTELEEFEACAGQLPPELKAEADHLIESIRQLLEKSEDAVEMEVRTEDFIRRYFPTLIRAVSNYCSHPDAAKAGALRHTMEVVTISVNNLYRSVAGNEDDITSIEQKILEQQLIREGLYSPFEDPR
ncbi:MAG: hypothetical protein IJ109_05775 [Firmicutes bacterium]|nr:hypothetical protein [Bacillota bacterium]